MNINHLVLASSSPYRRKLLEQAGIRVSLATPQADEATIKGGTPLVLARQRSELKGLSLELSLHHCLAIAADQVLEFEGRAYGKVASAEAAAEVLRSFQGRSHFLHSAYSLILYPAQAQPLLLKTRVCTAEMVMRPLSEAEIQAYVASGEWQGCAGCYQYENRGVQLFGEARGDVSTIIGMPLPPLLEDLRAFGIDCLVQPEGPWTLKT